MGTNSTDSAERDDTRVAALEGALPDGCVTTGTRKAAFFMAQEVTVERLGRRFEFFFVKSSPRGPGSAGMRVPPLLSGQLASRYLETALRAGGCEVGHRRGGRHKAFFRTLLCTGDAWELLRFFLNGAALINDQLPPESRAALQALTEATAGHDTNIAAGFLPRETCENWGARLHRNCIAEAGTFEQRPASSTGSSVSRASSRDCKWRVGPVFSSFKRNFSKRRKKRLMVFEKVSCGLRRDIYW